MFVCICICVCVHIRREGIEVGSVGDRNISTATPLVRGLCSHFLFLVSFRSYGPGKERWAPDRRMVKEARDPNLLLSTELHA